VEKTIKIIQKIKNEQQLVLETKKGKIRSNENRVLVGFR